MKQLNDILKGFELDAEWDDGTKRYNVKYMYHVVFDYFDVNDITVYPNGTIHAGVGINNDLLENCHTELDMFHVYKLTEIA